MAKSFKLIVLFFLLALCGKTYSQSDISFLQLSYNPAFPVGKFSDFNDKVSFRGFNIGYRYFFSDNFSLGINSGTLVFRKASNDIVNEMVQRDDKTITFSGKRYRYSNVVPILLTGYYYFETDQSVISYIGLGVGSYYVQKIVQIGLFESKESNFHFGIAPAVGVIIPAADYFSFIIEAQYNNALGSGSKESVNAMGIKIGFGWGI